MRDGNQSSRADMADDENTESDRLSFDTAFTYPKIFSVLQPNTKKLKLKSLTPSTIPNQNQNLKLLISKVLNQDWKIRTLSISKNLQEKTVRTRRRIQIQSRLLFIILSKMMR